MCTPTDYPPYSDDAPTVVHQPPTQADLARDVTAQRPWHYQHNDSPTDSDPVRPGRYCGPHCDLWEDPEAGHYMIPGLGDGNDRVPPSDTNGHPATSPGGATADHTHSDPDTLCPPWSRQPCPDRLQASVAQRLAWELSL